MSVMQNFKFFLRPIWNSRYVIRLRGYIFDFVEFLTNYSDERRRFRENTGYELNLANPKTFSEHLVWKKIHDRNPVLPILADKYRIRGYVKTKLGDSVEKYLIPLLWHGEDPSQIPFDKLNGEYIIKSNHNSGPHFIVENGKVPDRQKIIKSLKQQLSIPYGLFKHEWAYRKIKPRQVVIERLLRDDGGNIPKDYKFHMIGGECAFIQVDFDRFIDHSRTLYDKEWNYLPATLKFKQGREELRPRNLEEMLLLASRLSKDFDYVRIDLYAFGDKIYLGEMTHYPGSGMEKFDPIDFDYELGRLWKK